MLRDPDDEDDLLETLVSLAVPSDSDDEWELMLSHLHPKQRAFVEDPSPRKCALKGRRGGGSHGCCIWLAERWQDWPSVTSVFLAQTKESAKTILWPTLEKMDRRYKWGLDFNRLELTATWPNGYCVALKGAKDRVQVEKLRGFAHGLRRVAVDECGSFSSHDNLFRYMLQSVLSPQLMDHRHRGGGQIALISSPGLDPYGFFYEKTTGRDHMGRDVPAWSTHHWTALDNPFVDAEAYFIEEFTAGGHVINGAPVEQVVQQLLALKDVPPDAPEWDLLKSALSPTARREYLAQWVRDLDSLVYRLTPNNLTAEGYSLPAGQYRIVIGCDIGWGDGNGFAVVAKNIFAREIIVLHAYYLPEMSTAEIAAELLRLKRHWHTAEVYVDTGGEGERLLKDLEHYSVMATASGKGRKKVRIEYVRALIQTCVLKIRPEHCQELLSEMAALVWSEDRQSHREGFVDDVTDAVLIALMALGQQIVETQERPKPGTPAFQRLQDDLEFQDAIRQGKRLVRKWGTR